MSKNPSDIPLGNPQRLTHKRLRTPTRIPTVSGPRRLVHALKARVQRLLWRLLSAASK